MTWSMYAVVSLRPVVCARARARVCVCVFVGRARDVLAVYASRGFTVLQPCCDVALPWDSRHCAAGVP